MKLSWLPRCCLLSFFLLSFLQRPAFAVKKSYIVYLGRHSHGLDVLEAKVNRVTDSHYKLLASHVGSIEKAKDAIFYSYNKHINRFAATLKEDEAEALSRNPKVISIFLNRGRKLHTTRSWQFLGLEKSGDVSHHSPWKKARFGEDTIIANFDSGVWPESQSFNDEGLGPVPSKWKGLCQNDSKAGVPCNRKLIGARYFNNAYSAYAKEINVTLSTNLNTPRDSDGHGSHTLSTAGGSFAPKASVFGFGEGISKGRSPKAQSSKVIYS